MSDKKSTPSLTYVMTLDGLIVPLSNIDAISDRQFDDEEGVISTLKDGDKFDHSSFIFIKVNGVVHPVKTQDDWIRPFLDYGRSTYEYSYNKFLIFYSWSLLKENSHEHKNP